MSATVRKPTEQPKVKALDGQLTFGPSRAIDSQPAVNPGNEWLIPLAIRALDMTMSRKEAALVLGKDEGQFSRELSAGKLELRECAKFGDLYWRNYADELREHFQMFDKAELLAQAERHFERARYFYARAAER